MFVQKVDRSCRQNQFPQSCSSCSSTFTQKLFFSKFACHAIQKIAGCVLHKCPTRLVLSPAVNPHGSNKSMILHLKRFSRKGVEGSKYLCAIKIRVSGHQGGCFRLCSGNMFLRDKRWTDSPDLMIKPVLHEEEKQAD